MTLRAALAEKGWSQEQLAEAVNKVAPGAKKVTQALVSQWLRWEAGEQVGGTRITAERAVHIEMAIGSVTRQQLRPDVFGAAPAATDLPTEKAA